MLFSSMIFIYVFLPTVVLIYLLVRKEMRNYVLLISSLVFYAWGEPKYLAIMLLTILSNYVMAICIEKAIFNKSHYTQRKRKILIYLSWQSKDILLVMSLLINLGILCYFKYYNFFIDNINEIFHTNAIFVKALMPIGISFYIFQSISYIIDIYRGGEAQKDIFKLAFYISLFPQLIAGPIVKYHEFSSQIDEHQVSFNSISYGIKRFIIGLSKKMLIANVFGQVADKIFSQNPDSFSPAIAWLGAISYTIQIYYDFSGYSDMAIGLGAIFGFKFPENFNYPYISKSISEFWRRWHISLSSWFKQYLYIPIGGNKKGKFRTYVNLGIVFLATGFWHGAAWNFIIWGAWNGLFVIVEKVFNINRDNTRRSFFRSFILHFYCILVFVIGWVLFRSPDMSYAFTYVCNMFGLIPHSHNVYNLVYYMDTLEFITLPIALLFCFPIAKNLLVLSDKFVIVSCGTNIICYVLLILSSAYVAGSTYNPFIYFRF